jgi:hypothetical protein
MTYQVAFPDFPEADMPEIPQGFEDTSSHDDACPSFEHPGLGLRLHIDYADKALSEIPGGSRFGLYQLERWGDADSGGWDWPTLGTTDPKLVETDDWGAVLAAVAIAAHNPAA